MEASCSEKICGRIDEAAAARKAGKALGGVSSIRELALLQAFRHHWVRGRIAEERAGKRCTVLEEVEAIRCSDKTRTIGDVVYINVV
jgi:hypothetical protein